MATATIDEQTESLVSQPEAKLLFMSRRSELRLTKKSRYPIRGPHGQVEGMTQGQFVAFRDGVFRCAPAGEVTLVDSLDGGEVDVDGQELVAYLRKHRLFGNREEGFWEVDPVAPAPSKAELSTLIRLSQRADVEQLEAFIAQERAGWNRTDLLEAAEEALEASRAAIVELEQGEAQAAAKQAAQRGRSEPKE